MTHEAPSSAPDDENGGLRAPLIEHLIELRKRLIRCALSILVVFLALYPFSNRLYEFVSEPLIRMMPQGTRMIATEVASPFLAPFRLTVLTAIVITVPFLLYQIWGFVAPGLYRKEKRLALPLLVSSVLLFYLGMAFAYYVVFPVLFHFFTGTVPAHVEMMTDIDAYLSFVVKLFIAFGVAFEVPVATVLLVMTGIVSVDTLSKKRGYVVIGCFVIGMLFTPPDVLSQCMLAVPMWVLFEAGLLFGRLVSRRQSSPDDEEDAQADD
ncbi:twin-arginine translocase subunit TatC [Zymobacter sp. IVIA_5232.4 C2]|uniref:twin-arginine translocase subunit TatC n=1 Tax=Zymobacter sp. IVIA_5232.4 C2 TaxID=3394855 RepID=UPI0039C1EF9E